MKNIFTIKNLTSRSSILAFVIFIITNLVYWNPKLCNILYSLLTNLVNNETFVSNFGTLVIGGISTLIGVLFGYKEK